MSWGYGKNPAKNPSETSFFERTFWVLFRLFASHYKNHFKRWLCCTSARFLPSWCPRPQGSIVLIRLKKKVLCCKRLRFWNVCVLNFVLWSAWPPRTPATPNTGKAPTVTQTWLRRVDPKVTQKELKRHFQDSGVTFRSLWGWPPESPLSCYRCLKQKVGGWGWLSGRKPTTNLALSWNGEGFVIWALLASQNGASKKRSLPLGPGIAFGLIAFSKSSNLLLGWVWHSEVI